MDVVKEILMYLLKTSPFIIACLVPAMANYRQRERSHQFLIPFVVLVYTIVVMLFTDQLAKLVEDILTTILGVFTLLPYVGPYILSFLNSLANAINRSFPDIYLYNLAIAVCWAVVKWLIQKLVHLKWKKWTGNSKGFIGELVYSVGNKISGFFYHAWESAGKLFQKFADMRSMMKAIFIIALLLGWVDCALVWFNIETPFFEFPHFPVYGVIILGELYFFLNGKTPDEFGDSDEDDPEYRQVDCGIILEGLREMFKDRLGYSDRRPAPIVQKNRTDWKTLLEEGDNLDQITAAYFEELEKDNRTLDPDYIVASDKLLHGQSVLIYNPFYKDMTEYLLLPIFHAMLNHHSCLVVCGRNTEEAKISSWIRDGINDVTNLPKLWNIEFLNELPDDNEPAHIGILSFERIFDGPTLLKNQKFFQNVSLVLLLEPSNLLGAGQIGLRTVLQFCETGEQKPVYCILDRNADGLVDALSHAVRQSITEVIASPARQSGYCRAFWRAEGPGMQTRVMENVSHYMGIGGEITTHALHEGARVMHWYSGDKMPLIDLKWNIEQYYAPICGYLGLNGDQLELDSRFHHHKSLWHAGFGPGTFVVVEDEFCNAFEMERAFGARIRQRGFVNILSESYLLRDYMYDNDELFTNDPKAIPSIVPDYARTERNLVIRTLLRMRIGSIDENQLRHEFDLHGIKIGRQAPENVLRRLIERHTGKRCRIQPVLEQYGKVGGIVSTKKRYEISHQFVDGVFDSALRVAYFIIENESPRKNMMGNRLMDHIEQVLLPGQFFSYDGKYYQVRSISRDKGIIVRRAADHLNGRIYYRQLRQYRLFEEDKEHQKEELKTDHGAEGKLHGMVTDEVKNIRGIIMRAISTEIEVETAGYLESMKRNDLASAEYVALDDVSLITRRNHHKEILRMEFPDATPEIRFTLCVLLNELFQTVYPNEHGYITTLMSDVPDAIITDPNYSHKISAVVPKILADGYGENSILVIEDSNIDLGLLVSFARNFERFLEILADYLEWYLDPERTRLGETPTGTISRGGTSSNDGVSDGPDAEEVHDAEDAEEQQSMNAENADATETTYSNIALAMTQADTVMADQSQDDVDGEDEELLAKKRIKIAVNEQFEYLTFGFDKDNEPDWLALDETLAYLRGKDYLNSNLHRARGKVDQFDGDSDYDPDIPGTHYCDFCGAAMEQGSFVVLKDGRERCASCSKDAIKTRKQFKAVYNETIEEMKQVFDISFDKPIKVRMANAKKVNEGLVDYKPSPRFDPRVLGYAQGDTITVENGAPRWKMKQTLVHELTHVWQHNNWDTGFMSRYGKDSNVTEIMEGMAVWAEIQYLLSLNEKERAIMYKRNRDCDGSAYGVGMKRYVAKYPPKEQRKIARIKGPFGKFPPL